jgi:hypothetical protein
LVGFWVDGLMGFCYTIYIHALSFKILNYVLIMMTYKINVYNILAVKPGLRPDLIAA